MSKLLFQGVENETDATPELRAETKGRPGVPCLGFRTWDSDDPKLREECGVVAIHGHHDAARQAYLGLYALQHRGQ